MVHYTPHAFPTMLLLPMLQDYNQKNYKGYKNLIAADPNYLFKNWTSQANNPSFEDDNL